MPYGSRAGMEAVVGSTNVATWADKNGNANAGEITARINAALAAVDEHIDAVMRMTHHRMPLATAAGATPAAIASIADRLACVWLYDMFGVDDLPDGAKQHKLESIRQAANAELNEYRNGGRILDAS